LEGSPSNPDHASDGDGTLDRLKAARRSAGAVFGETPIQVPLPLPTSGGEEQADAEASAALEPRVRHAAIAAAFKTGLLSCFAGVFMGLVLFCALGSLGGGWPVFLALSVIIIAGPVAVLAAVGSYRQTLETERHKVGLCPHCGYDLRGSTGLRCPECGWRIVTPGRSKAPWSDADQRAQDYADQ
jgi:DNA-directed RNA polymerase subunit RPC12/RpoP